eukprot:TRINITY_DN6224_c0_g1_i9.p1 TRINITY_DN6224_c0_g1~~TRINITY_DN6224_c0_g1_i9.p1  ORF type:complete len:282 (+),score=36.04 TRINITY_DN6224_c0_g1_i9:61-846(+)
MCIRDRYQRRVHGGSSQSKSKIGNQKSMYFPNPNAPFLQQSLGTRSRPSLPNQYLAPSLMLSRMMASQHSANLLGPIKSMQHSSDNLSTVSTTCFIGESVPDPTNSPSRQLDPDLELYGTKTNGIETTNYQPSNTANQAITNPLEEDPVKTMLRKRLFSQMHPKLLKKEKNRISAKKSRANRKRYIGLLETKIKELEHQFELSSGVLAHSRRELEKPLEFLKILGKFTVDRKTNFSNCMKFINHDGDEKKLVESLLTFHVN